MSDKRPTMLSEEERAKLLAWAREGIGPTEMARRLKRPMTNLQATYRRIVREGLIPKRERPSWRPWMPKEIDQLQNLIDQGFSYDAIARKMGRTRDSIVVKSKRLHYRVLTTPESMTASEVANLLGVKCEKTVIRWIKFRWLRGMNAGTEQKPLWRIPVLSLYEFLEESRYWMAWHPDHVTEATLREYCQELRADKPRWLRQTEVAQRYHVDVGTVGQWIQKGYLPSARYGNHWVNEADLVGWVPPCEWDRREWRQYRKRFYVQSTKELEPMQRTFGEYLASLRQACGLTVRELQDMSEVSGISCLEHNTRPPRKIDSLAKALGVPADLLYYVAGEIPPDITAQTLAVLPDPERVLAAFAAFREVLAAPSKKQQEAA